MFCVRQKWYLNLNGLGYTSSYFNYHHWSIICRIESNMLNTEVCQWWEQGFFFVRIL